MYQAANAMGSDDEDSLNETLRIKLSMKMKVLALVEEILHLETIEKKYTIICTYNAICIIQVDNAIRIIQVVQDFFHQPYHKSSEFC